MTKLLNLTFEQYAFLEDLSSCKNDNGKKKNPEINTYDLANSIQYGLVSKVPDLSREEKCEIICFFSNIPPSVVYNVKEFLNGTHNEYLLGEITQTHTPKPFFKKIPQAQTSTVH